MSEERWLILVLVFALVAFGFIFLVEQQRCEQWREEATEAGYRCMLGCIGESCEREALDSCMSECYEVRQFCVGWPGEIGLDG